MAEPAVRVEDLGKRYALGEREQYLALRDVLARAPGRLASRLRRGREAGPRERPHAWALRHLTFDVHHGEVVGVIGNNGAGKSTLLKLLSRITYPTEGRAVMRGRVGSLLEVGSGFHPELTGAENILLNGAILGMRKAEVDRRFDEIVEFSGVSEFLSTPVKRYSTGMYMRLAFAVAAHLEPEILVVDEVLAVGDAAFQKKCLGKMGEVAQQGRTVLFVSHNMAAVQALCGRAVLLDGGRLVDRGPTAAVVQRYLTSGAAEAAVPLGERRDREGDGGARLTGLRIEPADGAPAVRTGGRLRITVAFEADRPLTAPRFIANVCDLSNAGIFAFDSDMAAGGLPPTLPARGRVTCVTDPAPVTPGRCYVNLELWRAGAIADAVQYAAYFDVEEDDFYGTGRLPDREWAMCVLRHEWSAAAGS